MTATGAKSPTLTVAEFNKRKKRRESIHPMVVDDDAAKGYELAERALTVAKAIGNDEAILAAQKTLAEAEQELRAGTVIFRLRAMPREGDGSFDVLKAEHPPNKDDHAKSQEDTGDPKAKARWHPETFLPALVAASLVEPEVTVEQAADWQREWNDGEWFGLVAAALDVNQRASTTGSLVFS
jgi:hypothetical protein